MSLEVIIGNLNKYANWLQPGRKVQIHKSLCSEFWWVLWCITLKVKEAYFDQSLKAVRSSKRWDKHYYGAWQHHLPRANGWIGTVFLNILDLKVWHFPGLHSGLRTGWQHASMVQGEETYISCLKPSYFLSTWEPQEDKLIKDTSLHYFEVCAVHLSMPNTVLGDN